MDFSTIKRKVKNCKYKSPKAFLHDVDLVARNCKAYNQEGSPIFQLADVLEEMIKKKAKVFFGKKEALLLAAQPSLLEEVRRFPEEKVRELTACMSGLGQEELLAVGRIVKEKAPLCMEILENQTYKVSFRNLPEKLFDEILAFVRDMQKEQFAN